MSKDEAFKERHEKRMQKKKEVVDKHIEQANIEQGIVILITGNGKGKSTSAFGTLIRALGYGHKTGLVQFIKGTRRTGEVDFIKQRCPEVEYHAMATGFTWETQNWDKDQAAAIQTWEAGKPMLSDPSVNLLVLDELTYMLKYGYLDTAEVCDAIKNRPHMQTVIITGRGAVDELNDLADTISDLRDEKHAYRAGIKAQEGVDF